MSGIISSQPKSSTATYSPNATAVSTNDSPTTPRTLFATTKRNPSPTVSSTKSATSEPPMSYSPTYTTVSGSVSTCEKSRSKSPSISCIEALHTPQIETAQKATQQFTKTTADIIESVQKYSKNCELSSEMCVDLTTQFNNLLSIASKTQEAINSVYILDQALLWILCSAAFYSLHDKLEPFTKQIISYEPVILAQTLTQINYIFNTERNPKEPEVTALFNELIQKRQFCRLLLGIEDRLKKILPFVDAT